MRHHVCSEAELSEGECFKVEAFGLEIAVGRHQGRLFALDNICPHRGGPLSEGDLSDGCLHCPLHGWGFSVESGAMRGNPSMAVPVYQLQIESGEVYLLKAEA